MKIWQVNHFERVRMVLSKSYANKQLLKTEFASLFSAFFDPLEEEPIFVSTVCPPLLPSAYNMVVLHPIVVAQRERQALISKQLLRNLIIKIRSYAMKPFREMSENDQLRSYLFKFLMYPFLISATSELPEEYVGIAKVCNFAQYEKSIRFRKRFFTCKLNKLASEGRLTLPKQNHRLWLLRVANFSPADYGY